MCFFKLADIYVITDLCKHFTFLYSYSYSFEKIKKNHFFLYTILYFWNINLQKKFKTCCRKFLLGHFFFWPPRWRENWIKRVHLESLPESRRRALMAVIFLQVSADNSHKKFKRRRNLDVPFLSNSFLFKWNSEQRIRSFDAKPCQTGSINTKQEINLW